MMIAELKPFFGSYSKAQEILFLVKDAKDVVRQGFYDKELPPLESFCKENRLCLVKSTFKVVLNDNSAYSNQGLRLPASDPQPGMYLVYISKDQQKAYLASYYELTENHQGLGLLLGYPACCILFFIQNFHEQNTNLELKPINLYTNLTQRENDVVLLSHFPCSSDCQESIALGKKYLEVLQQVDKARAEKIKAILTVR